jgi:hypothetical protein
MNKTSNDRLYKLTGLKPPQTKSENTGHAGHVRRMDDTRLPKKILFGTVAGGKKSAGKPKKNRVDCLEEDCAGQTYPTVHGQ